MRFALFICAAAVAARADSLADILNRMDRSARDFKNMSANVKRVEYTDVLHETAETSGVVRLKRAKNGVVGIFDLAEPNKQTIRLSGRMVEVYRPKANVVEEYPTGKYAKSIDQFFLLGFGISASDLKKEYDIVAGPVETIDGKATTRLDLTPKTGEAKKLITKIELWVDGASNPVREKVLQPSKDYTEVLYSNLKLNTSIPDSAFELNLPAGVKRMPAAGK